MLRYNKHPLFLLLLFACMLLQVACKKDDVNSNPPQIRQVRAISPAPNDSVLTAALPGDFVVIQGSNLKGATSILFNGFSSAFNAGLFSENNLVVPVPNIVWDSVPAGKLNTLEVTTPGGTATYTFKITAPLPSILAISNEYAAAGTEITIIGSNFYGISKITFPGGKEVTTIKQVSSQIIMVTVPAGVTTAGPLIITGTYGTATSILLFNDFSTGVLQNADNVSNFSWGAGPISDNTLFPGNTGSYHRMNFENIGNGNGNWWEGSRSVNLSTWIGKTALTGLVNDYALKFEVYIKQEWNVGTILIRNADDWKYTARFAPWKVGATSVPFKTSGWQTVVIPLTEFRTKANGIDGSGESAPSLAALAGVEKQGLGFMFINDGATSVAAFDGAIDNIRVVKFK